MPLVPRFGISPKPVSEQLRIGRTDQGLAPRYMPATALLDMLSLFLSI